MTSYLDKLKKEDNPSRSKDMDTSKSHRKHKHKHHKHAKSIEKNVANSTTAYNSNETVKKVIKKITADSSDQVESTTEHESKFKPLEPVEETFKNVLDKPKKKKKAEKVSKVDKVHEEKSQQEFRVEQVVPPISKWENDDSDKDEPELKQSMLNKLQKATATMNLLQMKPVLVENDQQITNGIDSNEVKKTNESKDKDLKISLHEKKINSNALNISTSVKKSNKNIKEETEKKSLFKKKSNKNQVARSRSSSTAGRSSRSRSRSSRSDSYSSRSRSRSTKSSRSTRTRSSYRSRSRSITSRSSSRSSNSSYSSTRSSKANKKSSQRSATLKKYHKLSKRQSVSSRSRERSFSHSRSSRSSRRHSSYFSKRSNSSRSSRYSRSRSNSTRYSRRSYSSKSSSRSISSRNRYSSYSASSRSSRSSRSRSYTPVKKRSIRSRNRRNSRKMSKKPSKSVRSRRDHKYKTKRGSSYNSSSSYSSNSRSRSRSRSYSVESRRDKNHRRRRRRSRTSSKHKKSTRKSFTPSPRSRKSTTSVISPTSALPFSSSVPFKSRQVNNKFKIADKYSYIRNSAASAAAAATVVTTADTSLTAAAIAQSQATAAFLNRNKNPAFSGVKDPYFQSRYAFYKNTNLLNNNNNRASNTNTTDNKGDISQLLNGTKNGTTQVNKSAILSHLNLNNKAREELEKRKKLSKEAAQIESNSQETSPSKKKLDKQLENSLDNTPAIPITSYTSYNQEDEETDDEDEEEKDPSNKIKIDLKKRKLDVIKNNKDTVKKTKSNDVEDDEDDDGNSTYFNVFKTEAPSKSGKSTRTLTTKQIATLKSNVKKQPIIKQPIIKQSIIKQSIIKQPIIKSGQTQKDREEIIHQFIGPKLPDNSAKTIILSATSPKATLAKEENSDLIKSTSPQQHPQASVVPNQWKGTEVEQAQQNSNEPIGPAGPKINYTKDELAKYGDLSMISQAYAKISQVSVVNFSSNGASEVNMIELDNTATNLQNHEAKPVENIAMYTLPDQQTIQHNQEQIIQSDINKDQLLKAYQQEQQKKVITLMQQQQQQRNVQLQLHNIQQLRNNHHLQQLQNYQAIQAHHVLQAQQQQKQHMIAVQLEQLNLIKQQKIQNQVIHYPVQETPVALGVAELSNLIIPQDVTISREPKEQSTVPSASPQTTPNSIQNLTNTETSSIVTSNQEVITNQASENQKQILSVENINNTEKTETVEEAQIQPAQINQDNIEITTETFQILPQQQQILASPIDHNITKTQSPIQQNLLAQSPDVSHNRTNSNPQVSNSPVISPGLIQIQQTPQRLQYQPLQFLPVHNNQNNLVHHLNGNSNNVINLQHLQGHQQIQYGQVLMPQFEQPQQLNVLNAHQIAAIQQQQQLQAQLQHQQQLQLQQQQQQQQAVFHHPQYALQQQGVGISQTIVQPQIIPLRGNAMQNFAANQPQFILNNNNSPFYRILPQ